MIDAIQTALSGLVAASRKVEASASNIANMSTPDYKPLTTTQAAVQGGGVRSDFAPKDPPFTPVYDPDSPFADTRGFINAPNVDLASEAVNLQIAETAYKASLSVIRTQSEMDDELLRAVDTKA